MAERKCTDLGSLAGTMDSMVDDGTKDVRERISISNAHLYIIEINVRKFKSKFGGEESFSLVGLGVLKGYTEIMDIFISVDSDSDFIRGTSIPNGFIKLAQATLIKSSPLALGTDTCTFTIRADLRAKAKNRVFRKASKFDLSEMEVKINEVLNPKVVTFEEVHSSPSKRRVSVRGRVAEVYDPEIGVNKRRKIVIEDGGRRRLGVTMWGAQAERGFNVGEHVVLKGMETNVFRDTVSVNSTAVSSVTIEVEEAKKVVVTIDGYCDINHEVVTTDGQVFFLAELDDQQLLEAVELPIEKCCIIMGNRLYFDEGKSEEADEEELKK